MVESFHGRGGTKKGGAGGKRKLARGKHLSELGRPFTASKLSEKEERKNVRVQGGNTKAKLKKALYANVLTKDGFKKAKIKRVVESPDNRNYARMNVITKGCLIETDIGNAKVTSRPGQVGAINAVLVS